MSIRLPRRFSKVLVFPAVVVMVAALCQDASAQLNEKKIERDASGIYKGTIKKGKFTASTPGETPSTLTTGTEPGKIKVPVKEGNLSTSLTDSDLPSKAKLKGKEKKSKVQRGGDRIATKAVGTVAVPPSPMWVNCSITGNLDDKGAKWKGDCEAKGKKVWPGYWYDYDGEEGEMEPYWVEPTTYTVTGLDVDGKG